MLFIIVIYTNLHNIMVVINDKKCCMLQCNIISMIKSENNDNMLCYAMLT